MVISGTRESLRRRNCSREQLCAEEATPRNSCSLKILGAGRKGGETARGRFLDAMDLAYAAADVVVSRAGAMTCTEILLTGKPSILIPSPTAAEDHQTKNAYTMADLAGSKVITEDELDSSSLKHAINEVLGDENLMAEMAEKAKRAARPNASSDIAQCILSLVKCSST